MALCNIDDYNSQWISLEWRSVRGGGPPFSHLQSFQYWPLLLALRDSEAKPLKSDPSSVLFFFLMFIHF